MKTNYWETFQESSFYHVYNRGIDKKQIFFNPENKYYFLRKWKKYIHPFVDTYAFVLMDNHFHFIVSPKMIDSTLLDQVELQKTRKSLFFLAGEIGFNKFLEDQFKRLFSSYVLAVNKEQDRCGSLFQKRFKRVLIDNDAKLLQLICYVHHNPIHHGYYEDYQDWEHSSFSMIMNKNMDFVKSEKTFNLFKEITGLGHAFYSYHHEFKENQKKHLAELEMS